MIDSFPDPRSQNEWMIHERITTKNNLSPCSVTFWSHMNDRLLINLKNSLEAQDRMKETGDGLLLKGGGVVEVKSI